MEKFADILDLHGELRGIIVHKITEKITSYNVDKLSLVGF